MAFIVANSALNVLSVILENPDKIIPQFYICVQMFTVYTASPFY